MTRKYHEKYSLTGESPLVRVSWLIPKEIYQKLKQIKKTEGIAVHFFVQRALEKALKEKEKRKQT